MSRDTLTQILDLARWAPSGDNTQPWRFEITSDMSIQVHGFDTRDHVLYDFDGHPSHIAHGALLETIRIAASGFGMVATWTIRSSGGDRNPIYDVNFDATPTTTQDPLFPFIQSRTVQRRPMRLTPLTATQRRALVGASGDMFTVQLFEPSTERLRIAKLLWDSAKIRLTCPEAYPVHRDIIEWGARYSKDRIPEQAVGVDPGTARLMRWVMGNWQRVEFFNRYMLGTVIPRIQLDLLPAFFCAAHLLLRPVKPARALPDWVNLGVAVQRVWLTATQQGLHLQPQMTPIIFHWYVQAGRTFSAQQDLQNMASDLARRFKHLVSPSNASELGFFARVGNSRPPRSRSLRMDLTALTKSHDQPEGKFEG